MLICAICQNCHHIKVNNFSMVYCTENMWKPSYIQKIRHLILARSKIKFPTHYEIVVINGKQYYAHSYHLLPRLFVPNCYLYNSNCDKGEIHDVLTDILMNVPETRADCENLFSENELHLLKKYNKVNTNNLSIKNLDKRINQEEHFQNKMLFLIKNKLPLCPICRLPPVISIIYYPDESQPDIINKGFMIKCTNSECYYEKVETFKSLKQFSKRDYHKYKIAAINVKQKWCLNNNVNNHFMEEEEENDNK